MKAFLSYQFGDDIKEVIEILRQNNVAVFDARSDLDAGSTIQQATKAAIKDCDLAIFVYSSNSPSIAFEAGIASTLNKPTFSILAGGNDSSFLFDSTYIYAQPDEREKISFGLGMFLGQIKPKRTTGPLTKKAHRYYGGGEWMPTNLNKDVIQKYYGLASKNENQLETYFRELFIAYGMKWVAQASYGLGKKRRIADFSFWSDELTSLLGNPILVEIKFKIGPENLPTILEQINGLHEYYPDQCILFFYDKLEGISNLELPNSSISLFIEIPEFISLLADSGFAGAIKKMRNKLYHQY